MLEGPWLLVLAFYKRPDTVWAHLKQTWYRGVIGGVVANVGYGIAIYALVLGPMAHVAALRKHGPSPVHRRSFAPVDAVAPRQLRLLGVLD